MKKTISVLTVFALIVLCLFTSCHKPEYQPKKKISKIYESSSQTVWGISDDASSYYTYPKSLKERWTWDGNKLMQMDLDGDVLYFFYKNNRLDRFEAADIVAQVEYEGKYVKKVIGKDQNEILYEMEVLARDKHKITKTKYTYYYDYYIKNAKSLTAFDRKMNFMNSIISSNSLADIMSAKSTAMKKVKAGKGIESESYIVEFSYTKNNVSRVTMTYSDGVDTETESITLQYDNKKNPYYFNPMKYIDEFFEFGFAESENNITSIKYVNAKTPTIYTYEYDGEWPTKQIYKETWQFEGYGAIREHIRYFEYTK